MSVAFSLIGSWWSMSLTYLVVVHSPSHVWGVGRWMAWQKQRMHPVTAASSSWTPVRCGYLPSGAIALSAPATLLEDAPLCSGRCGAVEVRAHQQGGLATVPTNTVHLAVESQVTCATAHAPAAAPVRSRDSQSSALRVLLRSQLQARISASRQAQVNGPR